MQQDYSQLWDKCLAIIKDIIPSEQFNYWFSPLSFKSVENNVLTICCPSEFFAEQLEERYYTVLGRTLTRVFGRIRLVYEFPVVADDPSSVVSMGSAQGLQPILSGKNM